VLICRGCRFTPPELGPGWWGISRLSPVETVPVHHRVHFSLIHSPLLFLRKKKRKKEREKKKKERKISNQNY
jgi:hypothetical protein